MVLYDGSEEAVRTPVNIDGTDIEGAEFADVVTARPFNQRIDMRYTLGEATDEKVMRYYIPRYSVMVVSW